MRRMRTGGRPANPGWPESRPGLRLVRTPMGPRPLSAFELLLKSPRSYRYDASSSLSLIGRFDTKSAAMWAKQPFLRGKQHRC